MRCHAAEWGAVTGRFGPHKPGADRRTGGPVGFRKEAASAVKAWLHGPGGRAGLKIRLDQGVALHTSSGPEEWPGDEIKHRGGAPVGVRPTLLGAHASPGVLFKCDADRRSTPSPVWEKGKRDGRCTPASFGRAGGAMSNSLSLPTTSSPRPLAGEGGERGAKRARAGRGLCLQEVVQNEASPALTSLSLHSGTSPASGRGEECPGRG